MLNVKRPREDRTTGPPDFHRTEYVLGLDLGQSNDPSALTVTEKRTPVWEAPIGRQGQTAGTPSYAVVWIDRKDLGTPYPDVVRKVAAVQRAPETGDDPPLVMDATGIGRPVVDQFHEEGLEPIQITFTSGDSVTRENREYRVPKADLATTVQTLLQNGRLSIAEDLGGAGVLVREMKQFRVKYSQSGHARFEHAQESDTDDVLLSLACALWFAENGSVRTRGGATVPL